MTPDELLVLIRKTAQQEGPLSLKRFCEVTGISRRTMKSCFDSWAQACEQAGVMPAPTGKDFLVPNPGISREKCIEEMRRVAKILGRTSLSISEFKRNARFSIGPIHRHFGGSWLKALAEAGLTVSPHCFEELSVGQMAGEFTAVVVELRRIPTLREIIRRSHMGEYRLSVKFGGYATFKRRVIEFALSNHLTKDEPVLEVMKEELRRLSKNQSLAGEPIPPHLHGRVLGFRAFQYEPTYENEVVAIFSAVAPELGFEIIAIRPAFPDCEAQRRIKGRRSRFKKCLIEFELRSRDFVSHNHPIKGCDLIVCWEHDWTDCPLEVIELRQEIRRLRGWRR